MIVPAVQLSNKDIPALINAVPFTYLSASIAYQIVQHAKTAFPALLFVRIPYRRSFSASLKEILCSYLIFLHSVI